MSALPRIHALLKCSIVVKVMSQTPPGYGDQPDMPHTASAKKRLRQNESRRIRNRTTIKSLRTLMRRVETAAAAGDVAVLQAECQEAAKKHDQAAAKGIIHKNRSSRVKSHLAAILAQPGKTGTAAKSTK